MEYGCIAQIKQESQVKRFTFLAEEDISEQALHHFRSLKPEKRTLVNLKKFIESEIVSFS